MTYQENRPPLKRKVRIVNFSSRVVFVFTEAGVTRRMTKTPIKPPKTRIKVAKNAWDHVPTCDTWFHAPGVRLRKKRSQNRRFRILSMLYRKCRKLRGLVYS